MMETRLKCKEHSLISTNNISISSRVTSLVPFTWQQNKNTHHGHGITKWKTLLLRARIFLLHVSLLFKNKTLFQPISQQKWRNKWIDNTESNETYRNRERVRERENRFLCACVQKRNDAREGQLEWKMNTHSQAQTQDIFTFVWLDVSNSTLQTNKQIYF